MKPLSRRGFFGALCGAAAAPAVKAAAANNYLGGAITDVDFKLNFSQLAAMSYTPPCPPTLGQWLDEMRFVQQLEKKMRPATAAESA